MKKQQQLKKLQEELEAAVGRLPLAKHKEDIVHGEGSAESEVVLIGEAPGYYESVERRPFVGRSGKLLRKVLAEVGHPPETVYISNIVKVRPPENRDPTPKEIAAYRPFLNQEIDIIQPKLIVTLGRFSMAKFIPDAKISQIHGRLQKVSWNEKTIFVLPMYHPAAGLRSGKVLQLFIDDFNKLSPILEWIESKQKDLNLESQVKDLLL